MKKQIELEDWEVEYLVEYMETIKVGGHSDDRIDALESIREKLRKHLS